MNVFDEGPHEGGAVLTAGVSEGLTFLWGRLYLHANNIEIILALLLAGYVSYLGYLAVRRGEDGIRSAEVVFSAIVAVHALIVPLILAFIVGFPPDSPMTPGW